jgi:hypothetical protein
VALAQMVVSLVIFQQDHDLAFTMPPPRPAETCPDHRSGLKNTQPAGQVEKEAFFGVLASFWLRHPDASGLLRQRPMIGTTRPNPKTLAPHWLHYFLNRSKTSLHNSDNGDASDANCMFRQDMAAYGTTGYKKRPG